MNCLDQVITDQYALYNTDCLELVATLPDESVHLSVFSPPFFGGSRCLYQYSSSERDMSNARNNDEFFEHYGFLVKEIHRVLLPGRLVGVHTMDVPLNGANLGSDLADFPGDIIRLHRELGFCYAGRYHIFKEPLAVRNRTMAKGLAHKQIVEDSSLCDCASADYLLMFRKKGKNPIPIPHPTGLMNYAGEREVPRELLKFRGWTGKQTENRYSHWIWRQYASSFWFDIRSNRILKYKEARDKEDDAHMHPLQLDVIERCCVLWSNPGRETVFTPFLGVGSEVAGAVLNGRKGIGAELKPSFFRQAVKNLKEITASIANPEEGQRLMFDDPDESAPDESEGLS